MDGSEKTMSVKPIGWHAIGSQENEYGHAELYEEGNEDSLIQAVERLVAHMRQTERILLTTPTETLGKVAIITGPRVAGL